MFIVVIMSEHTIGLFQDYSRIDGLHRIGVSCDSKVSSRGKLRFYDTKYLVKLILAEIGFEIVKIFFY